MKKIGDCQRCKENDLVHRQEHDGSWLCCRCILQLWEEKQNSKPSPDPSSDRLES